MICLKMLKSVLYMTLTRPLQSDVFQGVTYPWEVLPKISEFIVKLGESLSEEEYEKSGGKCLDCQRCKRIPFSLYQWSGDHWKRCGSAPMRIYPGNAIVGEGRRLWVIPRTS